jgi:integrase
MVPDVAQALARLSQRAEGTDPDDLVFVGDRGGYVDGRALSRRYASAQKRAKARPLRFHDLRHTFGSLAVNTAYSVVELQAWMGHADQRTTTRYLHHKSQGDPARRLAGAFKVETSEEPDEVARPASGPRVAQTG